MADPNCIVEMVHIQIEKRETTPRLSLWLLKLAILVTLLSMVIGCDKDPEPMRVLEMHRMVYSYTAYAVNESGHYCWVRDIRASDSVKVGSLVLVEKNYWPFGKYTLHRP